MASLVMLDNDVVFKLACYGLADHTVGRLLSGIDVVGVLGTAPFVLKKRVGRSSKISNAELAVQRLREFLDHLEPMEPDDGEIELAATLEAQAQALDFEFDVGESLLFAMMVCRRGRALLTGDKRAVLALQGIASRNGSGLEGGLGRVICFEQVLLFLSQLCGASELRSRVCSEPAVDRSAAIAFACSSPSAESQPEEGLRSYVEHLRRSAPKVLHVFEDLSLLLAQEDGIGCAEAGN